ncbi:hypothetical protein CMUS01_15619 [Colletotrichum musicola]|uniref:Uncharacterized protein n=1 Tax=Colletotrichum musicola TaxID=2175873 RepID=A0A8H6IV15_9PEZI|nr:hypothetical protein CMUS01_15619 [Colletotrichum musicola]
MIHEYTNRCGQAHGGFRSYVAAQRWTGLANFIDEEDALIDSTFPGTDNEDTRTMLHHCALETKRFYLDIAVLGEDGVGHK